MTEAPFDELAKAVARGLSRRRLLAGVMGALAASGWHGRGQAQSGMSLVECSRQGGTGRLRSGLCHADAQCGAFQYRWEMYCSIGGQEVAFIHGGCSPCPGL